MPLRPKKSLLPDALKQKLSSFPSPRDVVQKMRKVQESIVQKHGSGSMKVRMEQSTTRSCLLALPAELRDMIWRFVFALDWNESEELFQSHAALNQYREVLVCCKQIWNEANQYFAAKRQGLLQHTRLTLTHGPVDGSESSLEETFDRVDALTESDVAAIRTLKLIHAESRHSHTYTFHDGAWHIEVDSRSVGRIVDCGHMVHCSVPFDIVSPFIPVMPGLNPFTWYDRRRWFTPRGLYCHFRYVIVNAGATRHQIQRLVNASGHDKLSKTELKHMLFHQWQSRGTLAC